MKKQLRLAGLVLTLCLSLGFGYWQRQGYAFGQLGSVLKRQDSLAAVSKAVSPVSATASAAPMPQLR